LPQQKKSDADHGVESEKPIIPLKPTVVIFLVMVGVQVPQKSVHDVFMTKPRHKFHDAKSRDENQNMDPHIK
jgi:hypothetical protein